MRFKSEASKVLLEYGPKLVKVASAEPVFVYVFYVVLLEAYILEELLEFLLVRVVVDYGRF